MEKQPVKPKEVNLHEKLSQWEAAIKANDGDRAEEIELFIRARAASGRHFPQEYEPVLERLGQLKAEAEAFRKARDIDKAIHDWLVIATSPEVVAAQAEALRVKNLRDELKLKQQVSDKRIAHEFNIGDVNYEEVPIDPNNDDDKFYRLLSGKSFRVKQDMSGLDNFAKEVVDIYGSKAGRVISGIREREGRGNLSETTFVANKSFSLPLDANDNEFQALGASLAEVYGAGKAKAVVKALDAQMAAEVQRNAYLESLK